MSEHAFDAARRSGYRGWFFFPSLDPKEQMPYFTRTEAAKKINWLYNNIGAVGLAIDGIAVDEVDVGMWPKATTENPTFNQIVTEMFDQQCGEAKVFSENGEDDFFSGQVTTRKEIGLRGELFRQKLRPGEGSRTPSNHFVPSWQVDNAWTSVDQSLWTDGIMRNANGRALQYRVLRDADGSSWDDISADDMDHLHDGFLVGQIRGMSSLSRVVRKLFSMDDIDRAETAGVLLRSRMAYAVEGLPDGQGPTMLMGDGPTATVNGPNGAKVVVQQVVARDGSEVQVATPPDGAKVTVLESSRQLDVVEFEKHLLTDVAYARGYPPEYVFYMGGIGQGTLARMVQKKVQRVKTHVRMHQLVPQYCRRWYHFWLWHQIVRAATDAAHPLFGVEIPKLWFKHKWNLPADDSVDIGREGRLFDDRLASGKMSPEDYHGMQGRDADDVENEIIAARVRCEAKLLKCATTLEAVNAAREKAGMQALTYDDVFRDPSKAAGNAPAPDPIEDPQPPDPPAPPKKKKMNGARF